MKLFHDVPEILALLLTEGYTLNMFPTASYPIRANRYAPHSDYIDVIGYDFTGAVFKMQVRDAPNGGEIRADIVPTVSVTTDEGVPTSRVSWTISETDMEAMPLDPSDPTASVILYHDLHITPTGDTKFVAWRGTFTVEHGVTQ